MAHANITWVVKAFKLEKGIDLSLTKEYNLTEVFVNLEDSGNSENKPQIALTPDLGSTWQFKADIIVDNDILDKLCIPYVGSKITRVVRRIKSITLITNKLEKLHVYL